MTASTVTTLVGVSAAVSLLACGTATFLQGRGIPQQDFRPRLLWLRAGTYISACWLFSVLAGTFEKIVANAPATTEQLRNSSWWLWTLLSVAIILLGYWVIWARWTLHFNRPRSIAAQVLFGVLWGTGSGQLFVAIYDLIATTNWSTWLVWLVAWCVIGGWQGVFQDVGWDVWVAPEHDTPWSIKRKVPASHIPNVTITLTYLALYENRLIFIGLQSLALVAASIYMRFPKWNETEPILAPATEPAYLGLTRATGFITDDPDPYRTQRESDRRRRSKTK